MSTDALALSPILLNAIPAIALAVGAIIVTFVFMWYWGVFRYPFYVWSTIVLLAIVTLVQLFGILPYDITLSLLHPSGSDEPINKILYDLVLGSWWTSFSLGWFIMPFFVTAYMYRYAITKAKAYWYSLQYNVVWYIIAGIICIIALVLMVYTIGFNLKNLHSLIIALTNAYGLFLLVFFFGHGCVELPRQIFKNADPVKRLKTKLNALNVAAEECSQASVNGDAALEGCYQMRNTLDPKMEADILPCLNQRQGDLSRLSRSRSLPDYLYDMKVPGKPYASMSRQSFSHATVKEIEKFLYLCDDTINSLDEFGFEIEQITKDLKSDVDDVIAYTNGSLLSRLKKTMRMFLGMIVVFCNGVICWGEVTMMIGKVEWGPWYILTHLEVSSIVLMLGILTPILSYMIFIGGWSVTRMRLGKKFYRFVPHHTNENSMYYWNLAMARLGAAIVYHFVLQIKATGTQTFDVYGDMREVLFFGSDTYNHMMPICMFIMMILVAFHVWEKMLDAMGIQRFHFDTSDMSVVESGRGLEIAKTVRPEFTELFEDPAVRSIIGEAPLLSSLSARSGYWYE